MSPKNPSKKGESRNIWKEKRGSQNSTAMGIGIMPLSNATLIPFASTRRFPKEYVRLSSG
jgi:hypothetical protein